MLNVSLNLTAVAAMLFSIVAPGQLIEVDGLNSPTAGSTPGGKGVIATMGVVFKVLPTPGRPNF